MSVMSPRLVLCPVDADGFPPLPTTIVIGGNTVALHDGSPEDYVIVDRPAREYREPTTGRVVVLSPVSPCVLPDDEAGAVVVAWVPSPERDGLNPLYSAVAAELENLGLILKEWAVVEDNGQFIIPSLEGDNSDEGLLVRAAWPTTWRRYTGQENPGDYDVDPPIEADPPAGERIIAAVLA